MNSVEYISASLENRPDSEEKQYIHQSQYSGDNDGGYNNHLDRANYVISARPDDLPKLGIGFFYKLNQFVH
jgi:hypothetical protein